MVFVAWLAFLAPLAPGNPLTTSQDAKSRAVLTGSVKNRFLEQSFQVATARLFHGALEII